MHNLLCIRNKKSEYLDCALPVYGRFIACKRAHADDARGTELTICEGLDNEALEQTLEFLKSGKIDVQNADVGALFCVVSHFGIEALKIGERAPIHCAFLSRLLQAVCTPILLEKPQNAIALLIDATQTENAELQALAWHSLNLVDGDKFKALIANAEMKQLRASNAALYTRVHDFVSTQI